MPPKIEMTGRKFNSLHVLRPADMYCSPSRTTHDMRWVCKCDCGKECIVRGSYLRNGHTKTCGHCLTFTICDGHAKCTLRNGREFIFDADDLTAVSKYRWAMDRFGYVTTSIHNRHVKLHRFLMNPSPHEVVDHINANPSDCRRQNLRIVSQMENTRNQSLPRSSTTGYKGVCYDKKHRQYMAHIQPQRRFVFLGYHDTPEEAAIAYNEAALRYFGEYARINVIGQPFTTVSAALLGEEGDAP